MPRFEQVPCHCIVLKITICFDRIVLKNSVYYIEYDVIYTV